MALTRQHQEELVEAVAAWMRFEGLCGRGKFLSEAMLAYPLAQFFAAHRYRVKPEFTYPGLKQEPGQTKPPKVDYAFMGCKNISGYLEVKFHSELLLQDVIRLWEMPGGGRRFLLLATVEQYRNKEYPWLKKCYLPTKERETREFQEASVPDIKNTHDEWLKRLEPRGKRKGQYKAELVAIREPLPPVRDSVTVALWRIFDWGKAGVSDI